MISPQIIEQIKERLDIVDVVGDFVRLKRSGQNYKALSPFTSEKTPSFYVVPAKGIFKDFSSGKGGDAITFIMEHEGMGYVEALKFLAARYGIAMEETAPDPAPQLRDSLYIALQFANQYFQENLKQTEEGQTIGLSYLRERGFHDQIIKKFELGYSLNSWDGLLKTAREKGFSEDILIKAGLIVKKDDGKVYDRFRGRAIFPVHQLSGKVVAFGARTLSKEKNQPKYINSPESEVYHKSDVLYGLYQAKNAIRQNDFCYLVEGYTDVISLYQSGIDNAVASSGTSLTEGQIRLMKRFTNHVVILFDGDNAGIRAAIRGIDLLLTGGLDVKIVALPEGEDPDSFSHRLGSAEVKKYLEENRKDFILFKVGLHANEARHDPLKKAEAIRDVVTSISCIPDAIKRSVYLQETAKLLQISEQLLISELNKTLITARREKQEDAPPSTALPVAAEQQPQPVDVDQMVQAQEREIIRLLLNYAEHAAEDTKLAQYLINELEEIEFTNPLYKEIYTLYTEAEVPDTFVFMEKASPEAKQTIAELTTFRYETSPLWSEKYHIYFPKEGDIVHDMAYSSVLRLKLRVIQKMIDGNIQKIKGSSSMAEEDELLTIHEQLKGAEKEIADILGIVISR